jgi:hypothetical protein
MTLPVLAGGVLVVAVVLLLMAAVSPRVRRADLKTGLIRAALAAIVLAAIAVGLIAVTSVGKPFLFGGALSVEGAIMLGFVGGAVIGVTYLVVAAGAISLGLLAGQGRGWASWGWLLGPLVVAVPIFGLRTCGLIW